MPWRVRQRGPIVLVALAFVTARVYARGAGVRFDAEEWERFWHFIDPVLLRDQLAESLWFLHAQPPLFNLALGVSVKWLGPAMPAVWHAGFVLCGLIVAVGIYVLARRLGATAWAAGIGAALFAASPATLLYEHFLFYTYPVSAGLMATALALSVYVSRGGTGPLAALLSAAVALALTRTLFHPLWVLLLGAYVLWTVRDRIRERRRAQLPVVLALVAACTVPLKNLWTVGDASTTTWRGMNLARVTLDRMPEGSRARWIASGKLSAVAAIGPFQPLARYQDALPMPEPTGIALLDRPAKQNGSVNFHNRAYVDISHTLERDAWTVIREQPGWYLRSVGMNLASSMEPAAGYGPLAPSRARLAALEDLHRLLLIHPADRRQGWLLLVGLPLLLVYGSVMAIRRRRDRAWHATVLYLVGTIVFVIGIGALFERTENARFRFLVDPFIVTLAIVALSDAARGWRRRIR